LSNNIAILIIDFNNSTRAFFNTVFSKNGNFSVTTAATPQEAFDIIDTDNTEVFDFILIDVAFLGDKNECIFLQKIMDHLSTKKSEIVVLTEQVEEEVKTLFVELGIKYILPKRVGATHLTSFMRNAYEESIASLSEKRILAPLICACEEKDSQKISTLLESPQIMEIINTNPKYSYLLGEYHIAQNRAAEALNFLKENIVKHNVSDKEVTIKCLGTMGKALCILGRFNDALQIFDKLAKKSPANLMHKILAGESALAGHDFDNATKRFNAVLSIDPNNQRAMIGITAVKLATGDHESALDNIVMLGSKADTHHIASYFNNAGVALVRANKIQEAANFFLKGITVFNRYRDIVAFNFAITLLRMGKIENARNYLREAREGSNFSTLKNKVIMQDYIELNEEQFFEKYSKERGAS
jgi:tetratricopeptide (TPR) repeat protein